MNIGLIFAGGVGSRMKSKKAKPKQFLEVHGKPIIVHTIELFQNTPEVDAVVVVCVADWISYMEDLSEKFRLTKVKKIVSGGETGQGSIYNGLLAAKEITGSEDSVVIIHDGVRPLINEKLIAANIESVEKKGSAVTIAPAKETFLIVDDENQVQSVPDRNHSLIAKAPQSFWLDEILNIHNKALKDGVTDSIDSSTLMYSYGKKLSVVEGPVENIKITTPDDFYMFKALFDARENEQIYGI
ncbi:IspD/TarI family cytidylyltransferase [Floricoccus penangensis]|uniref:Ribitol-5-phosphate cytidylyltransferase n=1 Tax=Floricoccus penangensis TaxID=1859475 RepID=A0A9Q5P298_9LACT|nr:IspD/TarI family cytidylyltransferase [Floricoccus penangensis]OFI47927.1 2-C-methyl-D-erythritol 4-phosphate cytidylyltransferase [Floricoccus penangensis]URZ87769.1 2-C-methyl-D-erythritol 4-phosphate cytidylyltransferase [Floricoccus penangensis]